MSLKNLLPGICLLLPALSFGQELHINPMINLRKDSAKNAAIIAAFNGFLKQKDKPNNENAFILKEELLETSVLTDELKHIEGSGLYKDTAFYKCYLTNIALLEGNRSLVQCAYMGTGDNQAVLRASFSFIATEKDHHYYFSSPLHANTQDWKSKKIGTFTYRFKDKLNEQQAAGYASLIARYDKKLAAPTELRIVYCCANAPDALYTMGVGYKLDYNGYASIALSSAENGQSILVCGNPGGGITYDPHDLWHARVRRVMSPAIINKPVDEGCAFLYGGSWGLTWQQIRKSFMDKLGNHADTNWLAIYESDYDHGDDPSKPLMAAYTINALIVAQLEKDKGFGAVKELLSCGHYEKSNANYFTALERLTGISRANFNERIGALVKAGNHS